MTAQTEGGSTADMEDAAGSSSADQSAASTALTDATTDNDSTSSATTGEPEPDASTTGGADDAGAPLFDDAVAYTIDPLPVLGDPTDVYAPVADGQSFPVALLLQGANVDKQHYSKFAHTVARYGFVVVVPNHTSVGITGSGLFVEQEIIVDTLAGIEQLSGEDGSDIEGLVDASVAGLLGHSYGGVVGVHALTGQCTFPFCTPPFELPAAVRAGVFYGTNMRPPFGGPIAPLANGGRGIGLVQGTADSKATPADAVETYQQIAGPPASLVTLLGANHYGLNDVSNPQGADPDPAPATLEQAVSIETSARFSGLLLRAWLLDDEHARDYVASQVDVNTTVQLED